MTNTQAWDYAIGMIKVDGLEPKYLIKIAEDSLMSNKLYGTKPHFFL